jgi:hypothetical protein
MYFLGQRNCSDGDCIEVLQRNALSEFPGFQAPTCELLNSLELRIAKYSYQLLDIPPSAFKQSKVAFA